MILYYMRSCRSCVTLKKLMDSMGLKPQLVNIQSLEGSESARVLGIRGVPTLVHEDRMVVGSISKQQLEDFLQDD